MTVAAPSSVVPQRVAAAVVLGLAASLVVRSAWPGIACAAGLAAASSAFVRPERAGLLVACSAVLAGAWWGSMRLAVLDRSLLAARIGWAETSLVTVTGPPRRGRFELRLPARVSRFGLLQIDEPVLLELPRGRAPPLGARLEVLGELVRPRGSSHGFDESRWLRRQGVHVVLRGDRWRIVGRRGGLPGFADRLRGWLGRSAARGLTGERRGIVEGVVLGDDAGLPDDLKRDFRASGLYHLLAVSGQNVALVAGSALVLAWLLGIPRLLGELGALAAIGAYVLAVGAQPSVVRAAVAGALGSLAWITARQKDRWHFLLLGAIVLLAWNPYTALDPGFELSFAAVVAIFSLAPRIRCRLDGYPIPRGLADVIAVSTACGLATAPVAWFQFHAIPLLTVPANALAAPAVVPLLGLGLAAAAVAPLSGGGAATLAALNGWCAAYLAGCAHLVGSLPFAQVRSGRAAAALALAALLAGAYASRRCRPS
ncbi:MAG TPA: ComEC/Rec2 family competence protein [Gaiellaceae bacterium]|jgi:competence protein ComEC|nr:ComEC/Rec2 family competence protein [Gaiellaceae bacterium]